MRPLASAKLDVTDSSLHACWNSIGVRGDKTCPALAENIHCRNCPTFGAAARSLLDREVATPPGGDAVPYFGEARESERPKDHSAIMFRIGGEWLALASSTLDEVVEMGALHSLPHRRSPIVLGLVNVRGELVVCVSLARLLGITVDENQLAIRPRRLLVLRGATGRLAVPVDEVQRTQRYHHAELLPPPASITRSGTTFTRALLTWGDGLASSLDETRLLDALARGLA